MKTAMPFKTLMPQPESVSIASGEDGSRSLDGPPFFPGKIKPTGPQSKRTFEIVETYIDVALGEIAVLGHDIRSGTGQEGDCHFADTHVPILHPAAVAAQVQRVEIVDVDMLSAIVSFSPPELRIRLAIQHVSHLDESFTETKLIVAYAVRKAGVTLGVRRVGLNHELGSHPRLVGIVFRVNPVVDEDQFGVGLGLVAEAVFGFGSRRLKSNMFSAFAVEAVTGTEVSMKFKGA